jgi:cytoskeletal protein RodZ
MSGPVQPSTPRERDKARARLRLLTRGVIVTATGATVAVGILVAHDRPGSTATRDTADSTTSSKGSVSTTTGSSSSSPSSSSTPTTTTSPPAVTSGATS